MRIKTRKTGEKQGKTKAFDEQQMKRTRKRLQKWRTTTDHELRKNRVSLTKRNIVIVRTNWA